MTETTAATAATPVRRGRPRWARVSRWLAPVILVIASVGVGLLHVPQHTSLSPYDEYVYVDYFDKVFKQGIVRYGEEVGDYARRELGCRGLRVLLPVPDDRCTNSPSILHDDSRFPMNGLTSADIYTPIYFAVTRAVAEPFLWIGLVDSPTQAGRFAGVVWLSAAAIAFFFVIRRLTFPPWASAGITLLIVGSLPAYWYDTYLSTDAPTLLVGAGMLLLAVRYVQGAGSGWWLVPASVLAIWLKFQNVAVIGAVALALLIWAVMGAASNGRRWLSSLIRDRRAQIALVMVVAALAAQVVWMLIRAVLSLHASSDQGTASDLTWDEMFLLLFRYLGGAGRGAGSGTAIIIASIAQVISIAGVVGLAAVTRPKTVIAAFAYGTLAMAVMVGPLFALAVKASTGYYFILPERYGLSLYPLFVACAALLVRRRPASTAVLAGLGVVSYVCSLFIPAA